MRALPWAAGWGCQAALVALFYHAPRPPRHRASQPATAAKSRGVCEDVDNVATHTTAAYFYGVLCVPYSIFTHFGLTHSLLLLSRDQAHAARALDPSRVKPRDSLV